MIRPFGMVLSTQLRDGDENFRRAYVALLVDKVELSRDKIQIAALTPLSNMP